MSTIKNYLFPVLAVVALVVSLWGKFSPAPVTPNTDQVIGGANGNLFAENYDPTIRYNGGYNSQLPIKTSSTLTATGGVTFSGIVDLGTTNTATSSLKAGCIQTTATSTASPIILSFGTSFTGSTTLPTGTAVSAGLVAWKFGTCPQ